jgi:hypothetical protein
MDVNSYVLFRGCVCECDRRCVSRDRGVCGWNKMFRSNVTKVS